MNESPETPDTRSADAMPGEERTTERTTERRGARSVAKAMRAIKAGHAADRGFMARLADSLTRIASSSAFFNLHVIWFATWILWNTGAFGFERFDPFPFGLLTMVVSLEAIFLSMFVLMAQSR